MDIPRGSIVAVMGPSRVGKTTVLRLISGQLRPDSGSIEVEGREVSTMSLRELYALVHADNAASARVLEKAGYRHSGQSRKDPSLRIFRIARADRAV